MALQGLQGCSGAGEVFLLFSPTAALDMQHKRLFGLCTKHPHYFNRHGSHLMVCLQWLRRHLRRTDISVKFSEFSICSKAACDCSRTHSTTHVLPGYPVVSVISFLLQGTKNVDLRQQRNKMHKAHIEEFLHSPRFFIITGSFTKSEINCLTMAITDRTDVNIHYHIKNWLDS